MSETRGADAIIHNQRVVPFAPNQLFAAFRQPELLALWWGPAGFTNTFERFEFETGGKWVFVMHGPDGSNYDNECVFGELVADKKIVVEHIPHPHFTLTITLTAQDGGTHIDWLQEFDTAEVAGSVRAICEPCNEENLDRWHKVVAEQIA